MAVKVSTNLSPFLTLVEGSTPSSPASGNQLVFLDSADHKFKRVNSSGTVTIIEGGGSSLSWQWIAKTANYTATAGDFVRCDASGGAFTVTLPTAVGVTSPIFVQKKDSSANKITINTTSAQTINGVSSKTLTLQDDVLCLVSDNANWQIAAQHLGDVVQLNFAQASDISITPTSATWTDLVANQSFTVDDANSLVEVAVMSSFFMGQASSSCGYRAVIDSAGTPTNQALAVGGYSPSGSYAGGTGGTFTLAGLATGSHTIKLQVYESTGANALCRPSTAPNTEFCNIRVIERKR